MTGQDAGFRDIFQGSEKIEILGKLPALIWAYIETGRQLVADLTAAPDSPGEAFADMLRILQVLNSAADHLEHQGLKRRLDVQTEMLDALQGGTISTTQFITSFTSRLPQMEEIAGPRPQAGGLQTINKQFVDIELEKFDRIKSGRSADIVMSMETLDEVRNYLAKEVVTEGISSILVIDSAGSLIVNIGSNIELDAVSLAAVAAANFAATEQIAKLIGERDFVLLFYKGHNESFHFRRVGEEYIIVTIFNNSLSLGLLRLKIAEVAQVLVKKLPKRQG